MTSQLDTAVRDALAKLADAPPPPGLAAGAIRTARRHRRLQATLAGFAVMAAGLLTVPVAVSSAGLGDTASESALEPLAVTAYGLGWEGSLLLDRDTGEYVELPYRSVAPSPDGARALVFDGDNGTRGPVRVGVLDIGTDQVRWIDGYVGAAGDSPGGWSPDSQRLLVTNRNGSGPPGFGTVDPDTLAARFVPHDDTEDPAINALGLRYVWTPGGDEIALTQSVGAAESDEDMVTAIRFYDLTGNLTRTWPATAPLTSEAGFAPDGTRIALQYPAPGEPIQIVDAATGAVQQTVNLPSGLLVGWADDEHLMVQEPGKALRVVTLAGAVIREVALVAWAAELHVGSSAGLTADAAGLTFGLR